MPNKQQEKVADDHEDQHNLQLNATIGKRVLLILGQPRDSKGVQVRRLWENHYRVNVFVGVDVTSAKVAHSFFLVTDGEGNILEATPPIAKQYHSAFSDDPQRPKLREPTPHPIEDCGPAWQTEPKL